MANKTVSFRLPEELILAIEEHARITGKTKTDLILAALCKAYDLPELASDSVTATSIQQQIDALKCQIDSLGQVSSTARAQLQERVNQTIDILSESVQPLQDIRQLSQPVPETDAIMPHETTVPSTVSQSDHELTIGQDKSLQSFSKFTLLDEASARDPKLLAEQMQYQMQAFDRVFAAIPELVFICDRMGHFTYLSPFGVGVWGIERGQLLGKLYHDAALPSEFLDFNVAQFEMALSFGKLSSTEIKVISNHATRHYEYTLSPIQEEKGLVIGVVGIALDITQRKQSELALQESLARYRKLFELANDMIFIVDAENHQIIDANFKASRRLRYTRKELCQMQIEDIESPESAAYFQSEIIPQLEKTGSAIFSHLLRRKSGDLIAVEISVRLIEFGDRLAYQSFARDLSGRTLPQSSAH
ncbi:MAG: PAS domain-containing protein [Cyanobacteria bacterium P01_E01_bin.6]